MRTPAHSLRRGFAFLAAGLAAAAVAGVGWSRCSGPGGPETEHAIALDRLLVRADASAAGVAECAACHQAAAGSAAPHGKAIPETVEEWRRTDAASEGRACTACHRVDPGHERAGGMLAESAARGFSASAKFATDGVVVVGKLELVAGAVGHRLPTTPGLDLLLAIEQLDYAGTSIAGTRREGVVGRRIEGGRELFDTRLLPGERKLLRYEGALDARARTLRARVEAWRSASLRGVAWEQATPLAP